MAKGDGAGEDRPWLAAPVLAAARKMIRGEVLVAEPMSRHTSWRVGGPADLFVNPVDRADLEQAVAFARRHGIPYTVLGHGTNVLVRDGGVRGMVIASGRALDYWSVEGTRVRAGAGVSLPTLARRIARHGLTGLEFGVGIPGTLGGALMMNAGAGGGDMSRVVRWVDILDEAGEPRRLGLEDLGFGYRRSRLQGRRLVILEAEMQLEPDDPAAIQARMQQHLDYRARTQPIGTANAGSVFKNPPGDFAGRLLELAGAKGMRVGGARVPAEHANFIVNDGSATPADILTVIERLRRLVRHHHGVDLELEVEILGEDGR